MVGMLAFLDEGTWLRDVGVPIVLSEPDAPAAAALDAIADRLATRRESLLGKPLGLRPA